MEQSAHPGVENPKAGPGAQPSIFTIAGTLSTAT